MEKFTNEIFKPAGEFTKRTDSQVYSSEEEAREVATNDFLKAKNLYTHKMLVYFTWNSPSNKPMEEFIVDNTLVAVCKKFHIKDTTATKRYINEATKFYLDRFDYLCKNLDKKKDETIQYYIWHNGPWDENFRNAMDVDFGFSPNDSYTWNYKYQFNNLWKFSFSAESFDLSLFLKDWLRHHHEGFGNGINGAWIDDLLVSQTSIDAEQFSEAFNTLQRAIKYVNDNIEHNTMSKMISDLVSWGYEGGKANDIINWYKKQSSAKKFNFGKYKTAQKEAKFLTIQYMQFKQLIKDNHWNKSEAHKNLPNSVYNALIEQGFDEFRIEHKDHKQHKQHATKDFSQYLIKTQDHCLYFPKRLATNPNFRTWWKANEESYKENGIEKLKFVEE